MARSPHQEHEPKQASVDQPPKSLSRASCDRIRLLRRYLKIAIRYCVENGLMDAILEPNEGVGSNQPTLFDALKANDPQERPLTDGCRWPFAIELIPHKFPEPGTLKKRVHFERE
jgi:hypothetical protein